MIGYGPNGVLIAALVATLIREPGIHNSPFITLNTELKNMSVL